LGNAETEAGKERKRKDSERIGRDESPDFASEVIKYTREEFGFLSQGLALRHQKREKINPREKEKRNTESQKNTRRE